MLETPGLDSLRDRTYPTCFRNWVKQQIQKRNAPPPPAAKTRVCFSYVRGVFETNGIPLDIQTVLKLFSTPGSFVPDLKDRILPIEQSGIVYRIPCRHCDVASIGGTGQRRETRHFSGFARISCSRCRSGRLQHWRLNVWLCRFSC